MERVESPDTKAESFGKEQDMQGADAEKRKPAIKSSIEDKISSLESTHPELKEEIDQLKPGFIEYESGKHELLGRIRKPIMHGTGSVSMGHILDEGFKAKPGDEVMHGERAALSAGTTDLRPISFAESDKSGEATAHLYAGLSSKESGLSIEAAKIKGMSPAEIYLEKVGLGIEGGIDLKLAREKINSRPDPNPELSREWLGKEVRQKFELLSGAGAYTFDAEKTKSNISEIQRAVNGQVSSPEELGEVLANLGMLNDLRYLFHPPGEQPEPWSKIPELLPIALEDAEKADSVIGRQLRRKLDAMKDKLAKFEALPEQQKQEIVEQYPCVFLVEGEGLELKPADWMTATQELHCSEDVSPDRIREIRVPKSKVIEVKRILEERGLSEARVVPLEYHEMEQLLND